MDTMCENHDHLFGRRGLVYNYTILVEIKGRSSGSIHSRRTNVADVPRTCAQCSTIPITLQTLNE